MAASTNTPLHLIGLKAICKKIGLSESTIWRLRVEGNFPNPVRISPNRQVWVEAEVDAWISQRMNHRPSAPATEGSDG